MSFIENDDINIVKRRNSNTLLRKNITEKFQRNSVNGNIRRSLNKKTATLLEQESLKLKDFLQRIFTNESLSRKNSKVSPSNSKLSPKRERLNTVLDSVAAELINNFTINNHTINNQEEEKQLSLKEGGQLIRRSANKITTIQDERQLKRIDRLGDSDNSEDLLVDKDEDSQFIILPEFIFLRFWEVIVFFCIIYVVTIETYVTGFVEETLSTFLIISLAIEYCFIIDFVMNFFIAYYDFNEDLITNRRMIIIHYLVTGFIVDFLSAIPFSTIFLLIDYKENPYLQYNLIRIVKITKLSKLSHALKFTKLLKIFKSDNRSFRLKFLDDLNISSNVKRFCKFFAYFLMFNHISACLWVFIASMDYPNWIVAAGLLDADNITLYINGLYFNLTTVFTIGYGDIHSVNLYERLFNIVVMLVGVLFYSFAITSLSNIVVKIDKKEKIYNKHRELVEEVRGKYKLDDNLYKLLTKYLTYDLQINRTDKKFLLNELPQQLRYKLINHIYQHPIKNLNFFKNTPKDFIYKAVTGLRQIKLSKNEYIIKVGHYLEEIYFVKKGKLIVIFPINKQKRVTIMNLYKNEHFGDIYMCKKMRSPIELKVISLQCELYCLSKTIFIELNEEFPRVIQLQIRKSLINTTKMELIAKKLLTKFQEDPLQVVRISPHHLNFIHKSDSEMSKSEFKIIPLVPKKSLSNDHLFKKSPLSKYLTNVPIIEENSSRSVSKRSSRQESNTPKLSTVCNNTNNNGKRISLKVESPSLENKSISINYNINIQNNVNIQNYFDKFVGSNLNKPDHTKDNTQIIISQRTDDPISQTTFRNKSQELSSLRKEAVRSPRKSLNRQNHFTFREEEEEHEESINSSLKEAYTNSLDSPKFKKINRSPLFGFFVDKFKQRGSDQTQQQRNNILASRLLNNTSFIDEPIIHKSKSKPIDSNAEIRRFSKFHYFDILENMKKDAMVKKNPDKYLINGARDTIKVSKNSKTIKRQIDRLTEIFENLLVTTVNLLKLRYKQNN
jgi:hypothetical protein